MPRAAAACGTNEKALQRVSQSCQYSGSLPPIRRWLMMRVQCDRAVQQAVWYSAPAYQLGFRAFSGLRNMAPTFVACSREA
jgi:hypothetical protein